MAIPVVPYIMISMTKQTLRMLVCQNGGTSLTSGWLLANCVLVARGIPLIPRVYIIKN